ncbi:Serine/threonine-protein phosphatase 6 regulatory ankyrin repeat subunit, partial [Globisporangium polare]
QEGKWVHRLLCEILVTAGVEVPKLVVFEDNQSCIKRCVYGSTALHLAAEEGHLNIAALLLGLDTPSAPAPPDALAQVTDLVSFGGEQLDVEDGHGNTPLLVAARSGRFEVVKLRAGASVHVQAGDGTTVLASAARWKDLSVVSLLFDLGHLTPRSSKDGERDSLLSATLLTLLDHRADTHEFQQMWTRLVDRMVAVYGRFAESPDSHRDSVYQFVMIAFRLIRLKSLCSLGSFVARLTTSDEIATRFCDFHTELACLEQAMSPDSLEAVRSDAQSRCESDELDLLRLFREKLESTDESFDSCLHTMEDQVEAASLLQHKMCSQGDKCSSELLDLLKLTLSKVRQASDVTPPQVPVWFIPPHELEVDQVVGELQIATAARAAPTAVRGKWSSADVMITQHRLSADSFAVAVEECARLNHPNVVTVFGASHLRTLFTAVTESVSSMSLREYLETEGSKNMLWQKLFEVALGLNYLSDHGISIESLRCDDIWVTTDGLAKINVLGCVTPEGDSAGNERARWQVPEVLRGESPLAASSIFSLGLCALEVWTGDAVENASVSSRALLENDRPGLPEGMTQAQRDLLQRMLDSDPSKRPSISSVIQTLKQFAHEQEEGARQEELGFEAIDAAAEALNEGDARPPWFISLQDLQCGRSTTINNGALGQVYRGTWHSTPVVIKFVGSEADGDKLSGMRFFHELRVWFPLRHPHIAKLYGACYVGKRVFVSENAEDGTLIEYLKREDGRPSSRTWQLLHQVALGLQYLHENNVVHNELRCNNVLIGADGTSKITNFGLSSILGCAEVQIEPAKQEAVHWRSPEYLRGDRPTLASDIYSFAMLIVEAVTGETPWGAMAAAEVKVQVQRGTLPVQPERFSGSQWSLIEMMCALDPSQRVQISFVVDKLWEFWQQQQR